MTLRELIDKLEHLPEKYKDRHICILGIDYDAVKLKITESIRYTDDAGYIDTIDIYGKKS